MIILLFVVIKFYFIFLAGGGATDVRTVVGNLFTRFIVAGAGILFLFDKISFVTRLF